MLYRTRILRAIIAISAGLVLVGCGPRPAPEATPEPRGSLEQVATPAELGFPFELERGGLAAIGNEGVRLRFIDVTEDSRCPADAMCIDQGKAVVSGELIDGQGQAQPFSLTVNAEGQQSLELGGYTLKALQLMPYPGTGEAPYVVTLVVE